MFDEILKAALRHARRIGELAYQPGARTLVTASYYPRAMQVIGAVNRGDILLENGIFNGDPTANQDIVDYVSAQLADFSGFHSRIYHFIPSTPNPIFGDSDPMQNEYGQSEVISEVVSAGPRGRLLEILKACPPGSYGSVMLSIFRPVYAVVGNIAAAKIDEFFGANSDLLKRSFEPDLNKLLSTKETEYWRKQEALYDYVAGLLLSQRRREILVELVNYIKNTAPMADMELISGDIDLISEEISGEVSASECTELSKYLESSNMVEQYLSDSE